MVQQPSPLNAIRLSDRERVILLEDIHESIQTHRDDPYHAWDRYRLAKSLALRTAGRRTLWQYRNDNINQMLADIASWIERLREQMNEEKEQRVPSERR